MTTDDKPSVPRPTPGHGFAHQQVRRGVSKTVSIRRKRPIHGACRSAVPCARRPRQRPLQRTNAQPPRRRQRQSPVLILGCGFSRLLHAVHQVEAGTDPRQYPPRRHCRRVRGNVVLEQIPRPHGRRGSLHLHAPARRNRTHARPSLPPRPRNKTVHHPHRGEIEPRTRGFSARKPAHMTGSRSRNARECR